MTKPKTTFSMRAVRKFSLPDDFALTWSPKSFTETVLEKKLVGLVARYGTAFTEAIAECVMMMGPDGLHNIDPNDGRKPIDVLNVFVNGMYLKNSLGDGEPVIPGLMPGPTKQVFEEKISAEKTEKGVKFMLEILAYSVSDISADDLETSVKLELEEVDKFGRMNGSLRLTMDTWNVNNDPRAVLECDANGIFKYDKDSMTAMGKAVKRNHFVNSKLDEGCDPEELVKALATYDGDNSDPLALLKEIRDALAERGVAKEEEDDDGEDQ